MYADCGEPKEQEERERQRSEPSLPAEYGTTVSRVRTLASLKRSEAGGQTGRDRLSLRVILRLAARESQRRLTNQIRAREAGVFPPELTVRRPPRSRRGR